MGLRSESWNQILGIKSLESNPWNQILGIGLGQANIKADFIARGLYHEQIKHWHRFYHPSQLMVISDTELRANPLEVMSRAFEFVGLPHHSLMASDLSKDNIAKVIAEQWSVPSFKRATARSPLLWFFCAIACALAGEEHFLRISCLKYA
jgi:hypothetical protein